MRRQVAKQLLAQYSPLVQKLFGKPAEYSNLQFNVQKGLTRNSDDNRVAQGGGGVVTFDKRWLRTADKADVRGALIHEATHAMGYGMGGKRAETFADYARYKLNPREVQGWNPSQEVLAMARRRDDDMPAGTRGNGPKDGRRRRNTGQQDMSHAPLLGPGQTFGYAAQAAGLQDSYAAAIAAIRAQGGAIRGEYKGALSDIRAQRIMGAAETEGAAIERGIVGSSADLSGRAAVVAEAATSRVDARGARNAALAGLRMQEMQAQTDLNSGMLQIQADKRTAQMELANQRFMEDAFSAQQQDYQAIYKKILARLLDSGKNPAGQDPRSTIPGYLDPMTYLREGSGWAPTQPYLPGASVTGR